MARHWLRLTAGLLTATLAVWLPFELVLQSSPGLGPEWLQAESLRAALIGGWNFPGHNEMGIFVPAPYSAQAAWKEGLVRLRHRAFPGEASVGYRAGAEGPDPGRVDIAVLGDSHAYGLEVDEDSTWESRLSQLTGFSVANLSLPWQGTSQYVPLFRRYGSRLHPRLVLITICPNDYWDNKVFRSWEELPTDRRGDFLIHKWHALYGRSARVASWVRWLRRSRVLRRAFIARRETRRYLMLTQKASFSTREREQLVSDVAALQKTAAARGAPLVAILTDIWWGRMFQEPRAQLQRSLRQRGIPVLDLSEELCGPGGCPRQFTVGGSDPHWNAAGHMRVAGEVVHFLRKKRLLPPPRR